MSTLSDLEITKACAEAMSVTVREVSGNKPEHTLRIVGVFGDSTYGNYWPLTNDAQAMALVKRFELSIYQHQDIATVTAYKYGGYRQDRHITDLNRAICECVAKLHASRPTPGSEK